MPTALDTSLRATAESLISSLGANVTLEPAPGGFDFAAGEAYDPDPGVTLKASPPAPVTREQLDGDVVVSTDFMVLMAATTLEALSKVPEVGGTINHTEGRFKILKVQPMYSGEQIAVYQVFVRG